MQLFRSTQPNDRKTEIEGSMIRVSVKRSSIFKALVQLLQLQIQIQILRSKFQMKHSTNSLGRFNEDYLTVETYHIQITGRVLHRKKVQSSRVCEGTGRES